MTEHFNGARPCNGCPNTIHMYSNSTFTIWKKLVYIIKSLVKVASGRKWFSIETLILFPSKSLQLIGFKKKQPSGCNSISQLGLAPKFHRNRSHNPANFKQESMVAETYGFWSKGPEFHWCGVLKLSKWIWINPDWLGQELATQFHSNHLPTFCKPGEDLKKINYILNYTNHKASISLWVSVAKQTRSRDSLYIPD